MEKDILEAINTNLETINELNEQNELLKSIDFSKPVDEETWHKICETPLRNSNLLAVLVKNTFPEATDIIVHCNYVYFKLLGFDIEIPTSRQYGININTSWYYRDEGEPKLILSDAQESMLRYYKELDNGAGWKTLARIRLTYEDWVLPFAWFFKYKWKKPDRKAFEELISEKENKLQESIKRYHETRKEMKTKAKKLRDELLPMIDKFSKKHFNYNSPYCYTIEEIISWEL